MRTFDTPPGFVLVLTQGEKLVESLALFAEQRRIASAWISGLGALCRVELGFYELERKEYFRRAFLDHYELLALQGNVAQKDGKPFVHLHAALGGRDFRATGGHLFEAEVGASAEIRVMPLSGALHREPDEASGLSLLARCQLDGTGVL